MNTVPQHRLTLLLLLCVTPAVPKVLFWGHYSIVYPKTNTPIVHVTGRPLVVPKKADFTEVQRMPAKQRLLGFHGRSNDACQCLHLPLSIVRRII